MADESGKESEMTEHLPAFYCVQHPIADTRCSCGRQPDLWHVGPDEYVVCIHCRIYDHIGSNLSSSWQHETERQWQRREAILSTFTEAEMYGPWSKDAPPHIVPLIEEMEWAVLLNDYSSGWLDKRIESNEELF